MTKAIEIYVTVNADNFQDFKVFGTFAAAHDFGRGEGYRGKRWSAGGRNVVEFDAGHGVRSFITIVMGDRWQKSVFAYLAKDGVWREVQNWNSRERLFDRQKAEDDALWLEIEAA